MTTTSPKPENADSGHQLSTIPAELRILRTIRSFLYFAALCAVCFTAIATETNGIPSWFVLPRLVWGEATNGIRAGITDGDPGSKGIMVFLALSRTNWSSHFVAPPNIKFAKVELCDTNGVIIVPLKGKKLDGDLPHKILVKDLPTAPEFKKIAKGGGGELMLRDWLAGNPATLQEFFIQDTYQIEKEADYSLTVCPVVYEFGLDRSFVTRLDLPCVTTKIDLNPSPQP